MDILSFFGSVWLAIFAVVFFIAMVIGCTYDRHQAESAKWWVFLAGFLVYGTHSYYSGYRLSLDSFLHADIWRIAGIYLAIGLGYSVIEFLLDVRRSTRYWSAAWASYVNAELGRTSAYKGPVVERETGPSRKDIANSFVSRHSNDRRIIGVMFNSEAENLIEPKVNRGALAESIGCWMIFWPFYMVSLIIGDLLMEVARIVADAIAYMSGRFVKVAFKNVFKFN